MKEAQQALAELAVLGDAEVRRLKDARARQGLAELAVLGVAEVRRLKDARARQGPAADGPDARARRRSSSASPPPVRLYPSSLMGVRQIRQRVHASHRAAADATMTKAVQPG